MLARIECWTAGLLVLSLVWPSWANAQSNIEDQEASALAAPAIPDADETMLRMSSLLSSLQSFTLHVEKTFDVIQDNGAKIQFSGAADIAVRRPDGIYLDYGDDLSVKEFWYDGRTFTLVDHLHGVYGADAAAPSIDSALQQLSVDYGIFLPLSGLFYSDPYARYTDGVMAKRYIGRHDVEGIPTDHFFFRDVRMDWQIWIEVGERPLPRKIVVTLRDQPGAPQHSITLSEWDLDERLDDSVFAAQVPEGTVKADFLKSEEPAP